MLYQKAHMGAFDRIVLVTSRQVLGELRDHLHTTVSDKVIAEVPKVLTNHDVPEIETIVKAALDAD